MKKIAAAFLTVLVLYGCSSKPLTETKPIQLSVNKEYFDSSASDMLHAIQSKLPSEWNPELSVNEEGNEYIKFNLYNNEWIIGIYSNYDEKPDTIAIYGNMPKSFEPRENALDNDIVKLLSDVLSTLDIDRPTSLAEAVYDKASIKSYGYYDTRYEYNGFTISLSLVEPDDETDHWFCPIYVSPTLEY